MFNFSFFNMCNRYDLKKVFFKSFFLLLVLTFGCVTDQDEKYAWSMNGEKSNTTSVESRIKKLKSQVKKLPDRADIRARLAQYYFVAEKLDHHYELAIETIKGALKLEPQNGKYNYTLGHYYLKMNHLKEAQKYFEKSIECIPEGYSGPHLELAYVLSLQDKNKEAIKEYKKILDLFPNQPTALYYLASNYDCIGEHKLAEKYFELCSKIESPHQDNAKEQFQRLRMLDQKKKSTAEK